MIRSESIVHYTLKRLRFSIECKCKMKHKKKTFIYIHLCIRCHSVNLRHLFFSLSCDCAHKHTHRHTQRPRSLVSIFVCYCCCCCSYGLLLLVLLLSLLTRSNFVVVVIILTDIIIVRLKRYNNQRINEDDYIHLFYNASTRPPIIKYKYIRHTFYAVLYRLLKVMALELVRLEWVNGTFFFYCRYNIHFKYLFAPITRAIEWNPASI